MTEGLLVRRMGSVRKCLWKMVFERHRQSTPQSGNVDAMGIGKVQPRTSLRRQ